MFFLGVTNPEAGLNGTPHAPDFGADDAPLASESESWPAFCPAG
jgi:hypothetical protein